jgi:hypothetical protein
MIPQIIRYYLNPDTTNIINNYLTDDSYFKTKNSFVLKYLKIGPFSSAKMMKVELSSLVDKDLEFPYREHQIKKVSEDNYYFILKFNSKDLINYDICIKVQDSGIKFYCWVNLWYSCLELISHYIFHKKLFLKTESTHEFSDDLIKMRNNNKKQPDFVQMKSIFYNEGSLTKDEKDEEESYNTLREMVIKNQIESFHFKNENGKVHFPKEAQSVKRRRVISTDRCQSVLQLIDDLSENPDLNRLISGLNAKAMQRNTGVFDKDSMSITLNADELDKFNKAKDMPGYFSLLLNFSLKV